MLASYDATETDRIGKVDRLGLGVLIIGADQVDQLLPYPFTSTHSDCGAVLL